MDGSQNISKNIIGTLLVQIPNYLFGIIAGIFLTRQLGPESKGIHTLLTTNILFMVMFLGMDVAGAIQFFVSNKKIEERTIKGISFYFLLIGTIIMAFLIFGPNYLSSMFFDSGYDTFFFKIYFLISFFINNMNAMIAGVLQAYSKFNLVNRVSLLNSILNLVTFSILYFLSQQKIVHGDLVAALTITIVILAINFSLLLYFYSQTTKEGINYKIKKEEIQTFIKFIIPAHLSIIINFFNFRLTIWLVSYYENNAELGYFSLALSFSQLLLMVTTAINTVLYPYYASQSDTTKLISNFTLAFKINMLISLAASCFIALFSNYLIPLFYGQKFIQSVEPVRILIFATFFSSMTQMIGYLFGAKDKNWLNTFIFFISILILFSSGILLIPKMGISGASLASLLSFIVSFILFYLLLRIHYKISFYSLFFLSGTELRRVKSIMSNRFSKSSPTKSK